MSLEIKLAANQDGRLILPAKFLQKEYTEFTHSEVSLTSGVAKTISTNVASIQFLAIFVDDGTPATIQVLKGTDTDYWEVNDAFVAIGAENFTALELTSDADCTVHVLIGG